MPMTIPSLHDFGTVNDGVTNDAPKIQQSLNTLDPNRGGWRFLPQSKGNALGAELIIPICAELTGEGSPGGSRDHAKGSSRLIKLANVPWALSYNPNGGHLTVGPALRRLHVFAGAGVTDGNGFRAHNTECGILEDIAVSDFINGTAVEINGVGGNGQYWTARNVTVANSLRGMHVTGPGGNGFRHEGGYCNGDVLGGNPRPESVGVLNDGGGDTYMNFGTCIQGWHYGMKLNTAGSQQSLQSTRFECNRIHLWIGPNSHGVSAIAIAIGRGDLVNPAGDIGIDVNGTDHHLQPTDIEGVSTGIWVRANARRVTIYAKGIHHCTDGITIEPGADVTIHDVPRDCGTAIKLLPGATYKRPVYETIP